MQAIYERDDRIIVFHQPASVGMAAVNNAGPVQLSSDLALARDDDDSEALNMSLTSIATRSTQFRAWYDHAGLSHSRDPRLSDPRRHIFQLNGEGFGLRQSRNVKS